MVYICLIFYSRIRRVKATGTWEQVSKKTGLAASAWVRVIVSRPLIQLSQLCLQTGCSSLFKLFHIPSLLENLWLEISRQKVPGSKPVLQPCTICPLPSEDTIILLKSCSTERSRFPPFRGKWTAGAEPRLSSLALVKHSPTSSPTPQVPVLLLYRFREGNVSLCVRALKHPK